MSTIETAQEAYEEFHKGFTLGGQGVAPKWDELLESHKDRWRNVVALARAPLHEALEEVDRVRVKLNACESSLRGAVRSSDEMRAQLSARWSLIKRMRQDVGGLGVSVPPGAAQEWGDAYRFAWNGNNHIEAAGAGFRALLRSVGSRLIESWPAADQDGEPVAPSPGDPVRAALEVLVKSLDDLIADSEGVAGLHRNGDVATWDELTSGGRFEDWLSSLDAARAALSVSTPTGEGETDLLVDRFADALKAKLRAAEAKYGWQNGWMKPDWSEDCQRDLALHVTKGDPLDVAAYAAFCWHHGWSTALAHPQQGGERDGWKLVPVELSDEMIVAMTCVEPGSMNWHARAYAARWEHSRMLSCLPTAPTSPSKSSGEEA